MITTLIPSFNAGELSPLIHLRSDLEKYRSGCRTLQNMMITPHGGVKRRPGLAYTATAIGPCRLFRFQASIEQGYILELSAGLVRFFERDSSVKLDEVDVTVANPYTMDDLPNVQMAQINNVAYFTHPRHPVLKLQRLSHTNWELAPVAFSYPAMLSENLDKSFSLATSAAGEVGANITVTASQALFTSDHVGSHFVISHERSPSGFEVQLKAISANNGGYSPDLLVQGAWNFSTRGTWNGVFEIQRNSGAGWSTIVSYYSELDANYSFGGTEDKRVRMRLKWNHYGNGSSNPKAVLEASGSYLRGLIKITGVTSGTVASAVVVEPVMSGATSYWREGAWSAAQGYPRTVAAHEQRLVFGGNTKNPQTVWASAVDDYENFEPGVEDSDSWSHTLVSGQQNDIQWMISHKLLLVGTSGDEWVMSAGRDDSVITPTSIRARRHSGNGSDYRAARLLDDSVIFVQRGGKVVRDMSYSFEADGYQTMELTLLAEHITGSGIIETALQTNPETVLWCITQDGRLIGLTYNKAQNIIGWQRHITGNGNSDGFESIAIKSAQSEDDQVWVVVRRTINGTVRRYIERLKPDGFFLEQPWSYLHPDLTEVPAWETAAYSEFATGDVVTGLGAAMPYIFFVCMDDHACTATTFTTDEYNGTVGGSTAQRIFDNWREIMVVTTATSGGGVLFPLVIPGNPIIDVGAWVLRGSLIYECVSAITAHHVDNHPGTGITWESFWEVVEIDLGDHVGFDAPDWKRYNVANLNYADETRVSYLGNLYECISAHNMTDSGDLTLTGFTTESVIPLSAYVPGSGGDWEDYWYKIDPTYGVGDIVSSDGKNFKCIENHTPDTVSRPGIGVDWGDYWELQTDAENLEFYVDSGVTWINPGEIVEMTGLSHLEGETVQILGNGAVLPERIVTGGKIVFDQEGDPTAFTDLSVGLKYESILEPMSLEVGMQNGTSVSREKRIHELVIYFKDTYGCKVSDRVNGQFDTLSFYDTSYGDSPRLFTGPMMHKLDSRHDMDASFVLKQDLPLPFQVLAIVPKFNIYGDNS